MGGLDDLIALVILADMNLSAVLLAYLLIVYFYIDN